ncbi:MAG: mechanosensitive ion channel protein [Deltaproteobacteria bacterium CG_4_9_14_3_um_filter_65_9]|nr:MAG: mechanosensitive ion channel protein [Deltaproteobacteria bacterium CG_4_9_14_3_um_filter_65_9]
MTRRPWWLVLLVVFPLVLPSTGAWAAKRRPEPKPAATVEPAKPAGAPVVLDGKTLFVVRERVMSFTPEDRASAIRRKLEMFLEGPLSHPETITVLEAETTSQIMGGEVVLMTVTDRDAAAEGKPRAELAKEVAESLRAAVRSHIEAYGNRSILLGAVYTLVATLVLVAFLVLFRRLFPRLYSAADAWKGTRIRSIRFQSVEVVRAESIVAFIRGALRWIRILVTVLLFYIYIPLVLSFFPWTKGVAAVLIGYIFGPLKVVGKGILNFLPNLFFIAVIVAVTHYALRLIRVIFTGMKRGTFTIPGFYPEWADPTFKIVRLLVVAFAAVVAFPYIPGSESPAFRGVSIFLGVLFSLGSTSAVANIVSGVILTYMRPFHVGDRVKIADSVGDVIEKTLLVTRVRTIKNVDVTIPNSMILSSHIVNYSSSAKECGLILNAGVTIGYDADWRKVHELLISAARRTADIQESPSPFVFQTSLDDFYVSYELNAYTEKPQVMAATYSLLHQNIQDVFNEAGVEIMSPHYSQIRDGNRMAIPDSSLPPGYAPPAFRVERVPGDPRKDG